MSGRYWEDEDDFMDDSDEFDDDIDDCIEGDSFGEYFGDH